MIHHKGLACPIGSLFGKAVGTVVENTPEDDKNQGHEVEPQPQVDVFLLFKELQRNEVKAGDEPEVGEEKFERCEWHTARNGSKYHPKQVKDNC
jgi:hypothetical protein